jgi:hypothetical protein
MFALTQPQASTAERLAVAGDWVEEGQVLFRMWVPASEVVAPFSGFFVQLVPGIGPWGVVRFEEERGQDGSPVGWSTEVIAPNAVEAETAARMRAQLVGALVGRLLFVEQTEAGRFEVALASLEVEPRG